MNTATRLFLLALFVTTVASGVGGAWLLCRYTCINIVDVYASAMRTSLFSGFLALGGFLFSLKTFIVIKMKEGLYDNPNYQRRAQTRNALRGTSFQEASLSGLYRPLRALTGLLFAAISMALMTATSQLTLGLVKTWWAAGACIGLAVGTLLLLVFVLWTIRGNLTLWFDALDDWAATQRLPPAEGAGDDSAKAD